MKVTVHYLFSKNNKIGSYGIRILTKSLSNIQLTQVPSHVAILVNGRWVHESTFNSGVRVVSYDKWLEINTEVFKKKTKRKLDYKEIKESFRAIKDKKYDWLGVIYFAVHILANILIGKKIPSENKWESKDRYFCSEVIGSMLKISFSMVAPIQIMQIAMGKMNVKNIRLIKDSGLN